MTGCFHECLAVFASLGVIAVFIYLYLLVNHVFEERGSIIAYVIKPVGKTGYPLKGINVS
jgi:hypothetical protein